MAYSHSCSYANYFDTLYVSYLKPMVYNTLDLRLDLGENKFIVISYQLVSILDGMWIRSVFDQNFEIMDIQKLEMSSIFFLTYASADFNQLNYNPALICLSKNNLK